MVFESQFDIPLTFNHRWTKVFIALDDKEIFTGAKCMQDMTLNGEQVLSLATFWLLPIDTMYGVGKRLEYTVYLVWDHPLFGIPSIRLIELWVVVFTTRIVVVAPIVYFAK